MLGVRRTSVSLCAHALQKTGLIQYSRGKIKILDRDGLKNAPASATKPFASTLIKHCRLTEQAQLAILPSGEEVVEPSSASIFSARAL